MRYKIPFIKPELPSLEEISVYYKQIVDSNWFSNFGPLEQKLSKDAARYIGGGVYAATVSNATTGLILLIKSLLSADSEKKEVLVPSFTFAAGAEAIIWCGYQPVFIDINLDSWQPDIRQAERYLEQNHSKVAGILFCNSFGVGSADIDEWEALTRSYSVPLLIDSAAGFGSEYKDGNKLGSRGDGEVFSFHVTKPFGVGEGGLVSSKSEALIKEFKALSNFGFNEHRETLKVGLNGKMQEINAAIGLWQLDRIDKRIKTRQNILRLYKDEFIPMGYKFQDNDERSTVGFVSMLAPSSDAARKLQEALKNLGIEANKYYNPPLHKHPAFNEYKYAGRLDNTEDTCNRITSVPSHGMVNKDLIRSLSRAINR